MLYLYSPALVPTHPVDRDTRLEITPAGWRVLGAPRREPWKEAVHTLFSALILAGAAGGIWLRRGSSRDIPLLLTVAAYTVVYSVFWPATRLRASFEVLLALYAGVFFCWILRRLSQRTRPSQGAR